MKFVDPTKKCHFCVESNSILNYKNSALFLNHVNYFGKIKKSYYSGTCRKHQAELSSNIKRARHMGLLAFTR
jgi:small subunit ribosomal protein S18